jgi:hypothetical protein
VRSVGFKNRGGERETKPGPSVAPIPEYDLHDVKEAAVTIDDKALKEPLIVWDERTPSMDIGTPYPDMVAFRKAIRR